MPDVHKRNITDGEFYKNYKSRIDTNFFPLNSTDQDEFSKRTREAIKVRIMDYANN